MNRMQVSLNWQQGVCFEGHTGSGHSLLLDGAPSAGGENLGARPMEMLLLGLAGCSAFDVVHILRKGRHEIQDCQVQVEADRADAIPAVFTRIHLHFQIKAAGVSDAVLKRAVALSATKYCSASIMLGKAVPISHSHELIQVEPSEEP